MLSDADRNKAADILMNAEKERKQAVQLTKTFPDIAIQDSYAISSLVANRKIAAGAKLIGALQSPGPRLRVLREKRRRGRDPDPGAGDRPVSVGHVGRVVRALG